MKLGPSNRRSVAGLADGVTSVVRGDFVEESAGLEVDGLTVGISAGVLGLLVVLDEISGVVGFGVVVDIGVVGIIVVEVECVVGLSVELVSTVGLVSEPLVPGVGVRFVGVVLIEVSELGGLALVSAIPEGTMDGIDGAGAGTGLSVELLLDVFVFGELTDSFIFSALPVLIFSSVAKTVPQSSPKQVITAIHFILSEFKKLTTELF